MSKLLAEMIGTFALVFFGCSTILFMAGEVGLLGVGMAFGLTVMAVVYTLGPISGAHLNPAVTFGAMMAGRMGIPEMVQYWAAQTLGGVLAALVLMVMGGDPGAASTLIGAPGLTAALIFEVVATFFFVTVILAITKEGKRDRAGRSGDRSDACNDPLRRHHGFGRQREPGAVNCHEHLRRRRSGPDLALCSGSAAWRWIGRICPPDRDHLDLIHRGHRLGAP